MIIETENIQPLIQLINGYYLSDKEIKQASETLKTLQKLLENRQPNFYIVNFSRVETDIIICYQGLENAKKRLEIEKRNNPDQDIRLLKNI